MFIRTKSKPSKSNPFNKSVQIVENFRTGTKVKQKIIKHMGVAYNDEQLTDLQNLAKLYLNELKESISPSLFSADDQQSLKENNNTTNADTNTNASTDTNPNPNTNTNKSNTNKTHPYTDEDYQLDIRTLTEQGRVIRGIHDIYGKLFDQLQLPNLFKNPSQHKKSIVNIFKQIVMARIANPDSKRASVNALEQQFGISLNLDKVYRMMDKIDDKTIDRLNNLRTEWERG